MTANEDQTTVLVLDQTGSSVPCGMEPRKVKLETYRKRSVVWSFFRDIDEGSVQCVLCNRYLHKKEHGSTTPMLRHLRLKHPTQVYRGMERENEAAASHDQQLMEIDGEQIISVVVSMDDDESSTRTTQNDSDPSPAVSGHFEGSQQGSLAHLIHEEDLSHIPNRHSRRRSLIWRLFEHLDNLNAARCRICMKKLHKSGGISNLRRHLVKRHPNVLSELLSTNHCPAVPSQDLNVASVSRETFIGTEPRQAPVKLVLEDGESHILTTLNETDNPVISLPDIPHGESADRIIETGGSTADCGTGETMWESGQKWIPVEVRVEDNKADVVTHSNEPVTSHVINDHPHLLQGSAHEARHSEAGHHSSERPPTKDRRRSVIWRHFDRHPKVFSELGSNTHKPQLSPDSNGHSRTAESPLIKQEMPVRPPFPIPGLKVSRQPEAEIRVFERELELIEALRRTQREEARALQQQRELLEKLRTVGAREAAAERETIESLRKAQQEEAEELIRQREELEKEKAELKKKWVELYQKIDEFSLLSKIKEDSGN